MSEQCIEMSKLRQELAQAQAEAATLRQALEAIVGMLRPSGERIQDEIVHSYTWVDYARQRAQEALDNAEISQALLEELRRLRVMAVAHAARDFLEAEPSHPMMDRLRTLERAVATLEKGEAAVSEQRMETDILRQELAQTQAEAAVLREALEAQISSAGHIADCIGEWRWSNGQPRGCNAKCQMARTALASNAGRALLEELRLLREVAEAARVAYALLRARYPLIADRTISLVSEEGTEMHRHWQECASDWWRIEKQLAVALENLRKVEETRRGEGQP